MIAIYHDMFTKHPINTCTPFDIFAYRIPIICVERVILPVLISTIIIGILI